MHAFDFACTLAVVTEPTLTAGPVKETERIQALDVARGFALLGIFFVNIQLMAQPLGTMMIHAPTGEGAASASAFYAVKVLFEYKSYPLFSMLFGMGIAIMYQRAKSTGRPFATVYLRRLALLAVFGAIHAFGIWFGDVLILYAIVALVAMWLVRLSARTLFVLAGAALALGTLWATGMTVLSSQTMEIGPVGPVHDGAYRDFVDALMSGQIQGPNDTRWMVAEMQSFRDGPYSQAVAMRGINWVSMSVFWFVLYASALHFGSMFLLGAALIKAGLFEPKNRVWLKRLVMLGVFVGLPMSAAAAAMLSLWHGSPKLSQPLAAMLVLLFGPMISLAYLAGAGLAADKLAGSLPVRAVAAAGRMALTNYLMQSLIVAAVMQSWGLARFGTFDRLERIGLVLAIYAGQLVVSLLWLRAFRMGPLEWLWRAGTYLRLPPMRRSPS